MNLAKGQERRSAWQKWILDRWTNTPGYLKWAGGILLGALVRLLLVKLFPEHWERFTHTILNARMPIWLAVTSLVLVLLLERTVPRVYHRVRTRDETMRLRTVFGVRWAIPPDVDRVQGPYCTVDAVLLRGTLWSGDASPTLWVCPSCGREFTTPEFPNIKLEVERQFGIVSDLKPFT